MFDFTDDISDFFKEVAKWLDWFIQGTSTFASGATFEFEQLKEILQHFPEAIRNVIFATFSMWVFLFFRNGKG